MPIHAPNHIQTSVGASPRPEPRRDWGVAPLYEAGATFSGSSKDLSRSSEREGEFRV
ncbi:MAG: hypothetical protein J6T78_09485 [Bacteroidaceae bacterium]|nr:hypothetical protein [Bacteroidaceae bacterium]